MQADRDEQIRASITQHIQDCCSQGRLDEMRLVAPMEIMPTRHRESLCVAEGAFAIATPIAPCATHYIASDRHTVGIGILDEAFLRDSTEPSDDRLLLGVWKT